MDKEQEIIPCLKPANNYIMDLESQLKRRQEFFIEDQSVIKELSKIIESRDDVIDDLNKKIRTINRYNNFYFAVSALIVIIVITAEILK